jgi:dTDP-4-dehydrorhamnose 3,5-epimerase
MVELTAENRRALFIPPYVAHGYQTLTDGAEVTYQVSGPYAPEGEQGFRYDDAAFGIAWPVPVTVISDKDAAWPLVPDAAEVVAP